MWKALVVRRTWEGEKGQGVAGQKLASVPVGELLVAETVECSSVLSRERR